MKKIAKVFAMIACIATLGLMTSCSKDNADQIIGKWEWVNVTYNGQDVYPQGSLAGYIWEFSESGTFTWTMPEMSNPKTSSYTIEKDQLKITVNDYTGTFKIKNIGKQKMTLEVVEWGSLLPPEGILTLNRI